MKVKCSAKLKYKDNGYRKALVLKYRFKLPKQIFQRRKSAFLTSDWDCTQEQFLIDCERWMDKNMIMDLIKIKIQNYIYDKKLDFKSDELIREVKSSKRIDFEIDIDVDSL